MKAIASLAFIILSATVLVADEHNVIRKLDRKIEIDGSINDWRARPFSPYGEDLPTEQIASEQSWTGWNSEGLWIAVETHEGSKLSTDQGMHRRVDIYADTRVIGNADYDRYGPGVYHFQVDQTPGAKGCKIKVDTSYAGSEDYSTSGCLSAATYLSNSWAVEIFLPWAAIGLTPQQEGRRMGFSIATSFLRGTSGAMSFGAKDVDAYNRISKNPMCFSSVVLEPSPDVGHDFYARAEEIVLENRPWLAIKAVFEDSAEHQLSISLPPSLGGNRVVQTHRSLGGGFSLYNDWVSLDSAAYRNSKLRVAICESSRGSKFDCVVPTPVADEIEAINSDIPTTQKDDSKIKFFRDCAFDAACILSPTENGIIPPQRIIRSELNPEPIKRLIGLFEAEANNSSAVKDGWLGHVVTIDLPTPDGARIPILVYYPTNFDPLKKYPAQIDVPGLIVGRTRLSLATRQIELARMDRIHVRIGQGFRISMFGRGNSSGVFGEDELLAIFDRIIPTLPIDKSRISIYGDSAGCSGALALAERHPGLFCYLHLKSGGQWLNSREQFLPNLFGMPIFLEAGSEDQICVDANESFELRLRQVGVQVFSKVVAGEGHVYARSEVPAALQNATTPRALTKLTFFTSTPTLSVPGGIGIVALEHWNSKASVSIDVSSGQTAIVTENVAVLSANSTLNGRKILIDGCNVAFPSSNGADFVFEKGNDGQWKQGNTQRGGGVKRFGHFGSADSIEHGPVLVVYGSLNLKTSTYLKRRALDVVRTRVGSLPGQIASAHFEIKVDSEVTDEDIRSKNLWLIGTILENSVTAKVALSAPLLPQPDAFIVDGKQARGSNILVSTLWPNAKASDHFVYLDQGNSSAAYSGQILSNRSADLTIQSVEPEKTTLLSSGFWNTSWTHLESPKT